jgi:hypothetical protein
MHILFLYSILDKDERQKLQNEIKGITIILTFELR